MAMHAFAQRAQRPWTDRSSSQFRGWLLGFGPLFIVDRHDCVSFGLPEMSRFLTGFRIRGIDASHRTIAMISLAFRELNISEKAPDMPMDFRGYAAENWHRHYQIATRTSISLRYERLNRQSSRPGDTRRVTRGCRRGVSPTLDSVSHRLQTLDIDSDADEWVFL